jgi:hypothetical protein
MTVLLSTPNVTGIWLEALDDLLLPLTGNLGDSYFPDDSSFYKALNVSNDDKYFIKSIDGLEPPGQKVAIAHTASGGKYQGKSSEDRELVFLIGLNPDWDKGETPKLLRDNLETMLSTGYDPKVRISLMGTIFPIGSVYAYVTKFEASLFDKDPVVQITFECLNPTFAAPNPTSYSPGDLDAKRPNIYNYGTAETGFQFAVKFTDDMNGWYIKQADHQSIGMTFDMTFHDKDVLSVSTIPGQRYVHWNKHRGKVKNMMGILTNNSEWIALHPGNNHFIMPNKTKWDWKGNLSFTVQYWGA